MRKVNSYLIKNQTEEESANCSTHQDQPVVGAPPLPSHQPSASTVGIDVTNSQHQGPWMFSGSRPTTLPRRTPHRLAHEEPPDSLRPPVPPTRTLSDHSKARSWQGSKVSTNSLGEESTAASGGEHGQSFLDDVLAKTYPTSISRQQKCGPSTKTNAHKYSSGNAPGSNHTMFISRTSPESESELLLGNPQLARMGVPGANKKMQPGPKNQFEGNHYHHHSSVHRSTTSNVSRTDSLSTVPDPPSLHYGRHYHCNTPGAFRMELQQGFPQYSNNDSDTVSTTFTRHPAGLEHEPQEPYSRQLAHDRCAIVEASLVDDDTMPPPPISSSTPAVSMGGTTQFSLGTSFTGGMLTSASPIVEAFPLDEIPSVQDFFQSKKVKCFVFLLLGVFVILALGTAYGVRGFSNSLWENSDITSNSTDGTMHNAPTSGPTSLYDLDLEYFVQVAIPDYTQISLRKEKSPQNKAFKWLKNNNSNLETYSTSRRLQRFALATFFYATGGDVRWNNHSLWLSDEDECTWFSSTDSIDDSIDLCNENGALQRLSLVDNNMRGTFPLELSLLSNLEILEMSRNVITGFLPSTLATLSTLRSIQLYDNYISGTIPSEFGALSMLESLDLEYNLLAQTLPATIGNLANLRNLLLDRNALRGSLPSDFGLLSTIETLHLFANALSGTIPPEIGHLSQVAELRLEVNRFSGALPSEVGMLTKITTLSIGNNTLSGTIPTEVGRLQQLSYLDVFNNFMTGTLPTELGLITSAESLYFERNNLEGTFPSEIGRLHQSLTRLWMYSNNLSGSIPTDLGKLTQLTDLNVSFNNFEGSLPTEVGQLQKAESLSFAFNSFHGRIPSELGQLSELRDLMLHGNLFTGWMPDEICRLKHTGRLSKIVVDCQFVTCFCCICGSYLV